VTINDIPKYFKALERPARVTVFRQHNVVLFKLRPEHIEETVNRFERSRPPFMRFLYKPLNIWDRFLIRKQKFRMELR
jgi:hypothetical protein